MDIDLLAKMIGELVVEHDEVALPEVGTFVAELSPAVFSDKGYTIVPPYRKLSFRQRISSDTLLVDRYVATSGKSRAEATDELQSFLMEMKEILKARKIIIFPGLGRLRATKENLFFFVQDPDLDIYPDGFGLEAVSLKSHPSADIAGPSFEVQAEMPAVEDYPVAATVPAASESELETAPHPEAGDAGMPKWLKALLVILAVLLVTAALLAVLGRVAPEFVDRLLYSPEEYDILHG